MYLQGFNDEPKWIYGILSFTKTVQRKYDCFSAKRI